MAAIIAEIVEPRSNSNATTKQTAGQPSDHPTYVGTLKAGLQDVAGKVESANSALVDAAPAVGSFEKAVDRAATVACVGIHLAYGDVPSAEAAVKKCRSPVSTP